MMLGLPPAQKQDMGEAGTGGSSGTAQAAGLCPLVSSVKGSLLQSSKAPRRKTCSLLCQHESPTGEGGRGEGGLLGLILHLNTSGCEEGGSALKARVGGREGRGSRWGCFVRRLPPLGYTSFPPCRGWFSHDCISSVVSVLAHCTQGGATMQPREGPRALEGEGSCTSSPFFFTRFQIQPFPTPTSLLTCTLETIQGKYVELYYS